jgi:hypothetical protein
MTKPVPPTRIVKGIELADLTPGQTVNLTELTALLQAAAEVGRATRPIVLTGPDTIPTPTGHPGVDFTIPAASTAPPPAAAPHTCGRFTEAQALVFCGLAASAVAVLDAALTGSRLALLLALITTAATALAAFVRVAEIRNHHRAAGPGGR